MIDARDVGHAGIRAGAFSDVCDLAEGVVVVFSGVGRIAGAGGEPEVCGDAAEGIVTDQFVLAFEIVGVGEMEARRSKGLDPQLGFLDLYFFGQESPYGRPLSDKSSVLKQ